VQERLTISNLLNLFKARLTANWLPANQSPDKPINLQLIDIDEPQGPQKWEESKPETRLAVTANDRCQHQRFISRPIRAFGSNGVVVLFNAIAQSASAPRTTTPDFRQDISTAGFRHETAISSSRSRPSACGRPLGSARTCSAASTLPHAGRPYSHVR
jgi:hypothetical protein